MRIILASCLSAIGFFLIGPSLLLNMPDSLILMVLGQVIGGIVMANMFIPSLSEMMESANERFADHDEREINNMCAGIFNSFIGVGYLVAPLYGSAAVELTGFRSAMDITACFDIVFALSYFILAGGYKAFYRTYYNFKQP